MKESQLLTSIHFVVTKATAVLYSEAPDARNERVATHAKPAVSARSNEMRSNTDKIGVPRNVTGDGALRRH
jgi:hypothetical protein